MRFLHVVEANGRYSATLDEAPTPVPRKGELLIRVRGSGVNRADLAQIAGRYGPPPGESDILGLEAAGTDVATGEAVCALLGGGGHAEYVAAPGGQVFPAPPTLEPITAAGIPEAFITAFVTVVMEGGLEKGATLLVHAGGSGVGLAAIQLGKHLGARVAATTRTREKLPALLAAGVDLAIDTRNEDVAASIEARWGQDAVDVVLDPVGAATLATDLRVLAIGGRIVVIATMSGARVDTDLRLVMQKRARVIGSMLRARGRPEKAAIVARFREELLPAIAAGALSVRVDAVFAPHQAAEAFQRLRDNHNVGKILLAWPGD